MTHRRWVIGPKIGYHLLRLHLPWNFQSHIFDKSPQPAMTLIIPIWNHRTFTRFHCLNFVNEREPNPSDGWLVPGGANNFSLGPLDPSVHVCSAQIIDKRRLARVGDAFSQFSYQSSFSRTFCDINIQFVPKVNGFASSLRQIIHKLLQWQILIKTIYETGVI